MRLQKLIPVRQRFPVRRLAAVREGTLEAMRSAAWTSAVKPGARIAVGVGSRGISNIAVMTKAVVDFWTERGCKPFIIPVMGSHGGASAEGQAQVLEHYGISEATMGVPVVSSLDVVQIGKTPEGIAVSMYKQAYESDGVMLLSRVKWHTSFEGKLESGAHKMMAIGLGKWEGAKRYHSFALRLGMEPVIRSVGKVVLDTGRMLGGLAILEDAHHHTAEVHALGADGMAEQEEVLLERTKGWKAGLPFNEIDLLIIDEMGKNISGTGSDTKVMNRGLLGRNTLPGVVKIQRVFTRDLTTESGGTFECYWDIDFPPGFTAFFLRDYGVKAIGDPELNYVQVEWSKAASFPNGALSFGSAYDLGPTTTWLGEGGDGSSFTDGEIRLYPVLDEPWELSVKSNKLRIGFGEHGLMLEGFYPWWAGRIFVR